jgi:hypothetical protein
MSMPTIVGARNSLLRRRAREISSCSRVAHPLRQTPFSPTDWRSLVAGVRLGRATGSGRRSVTIPDGDNGARAKRSWVWSEPDPQVAFHFSTASAFWPGRCQDGSAFAVELPGGGDANVSGRFVGLSKLVVQFLYQARRVKIVSPNTLTRICIQIASVVSIRMK